MTLSNLHFNNRMALAAVLSTEQGGVSTDTERPSEKATVIYREEASGYDKDDSRKGGGKWPHYG